MLFGRFAVQNGLHIDHRSFRCSHYSGLVYRPTILLSTLVCGSNRSAEVTCPPRPALTPFIQPLNRLKAVLLVILAFWWLVTTFWASFQHAPSIFNSSSDLPGFDHWLVRCVDFWAILGAKPGSPGLNIAFWGLGITF